MELIKAPWVPIASIELTAKLGATLVIDTNTHGIDDFIMMKRP